jgi:hypothetical protein
MIGVAGDMRARVDYAALDGAISAVKGACDIDSGKIDDLVKSLKTSRNASIASTVGSGLNLATGVVGATVVNKKEGLGGLKMGMNIAAAAGSVTTTVASTVSAVSNMGIGGKVDAIVGQIKSCKTAFAPAPAKTGDAAFDSRVEKYALARNACDIDTGELEKVKTTAGVNVGLSAVGALSGVSGITGQMGVNPLSKLGGGKGGAVIGAVAGVASAGGAGGIASVAAPATTFGEKKIGSTADPATATADKTGLPYGIGPSKTLGGFIDMSDGSKMTNHKYQEALRDGKISLPPDTKGSAASDESKSADAKSSNSKPSALKQAGSKLIAKDKVNSANMVSMISAGVGVAASAVAIGTSANALGKVEDYKGKIDACKNALAAL